jgi:hypothetical protein
MAQEQAPDPAMAALRTVHYLRWLGCNHSEPLPMENDLLAFVYDIPYFGACGVFPPMHLLNQQLLRGGGSGGMSPGASWETFSLTPREYEDLVHAVKTVPVESLRDRARYAHVQFTFDPDFDGPPETYPVRREPQRWDRHIPPEWREYVEWLGAVSARHADRHDAELRRAGFLG